MTYRLKNITIAVALALVAALLTSFYVTNYQRNVRKDETNVPSTWPRATSRRAPPARISPEGIPARRARSSAGASCPGAISNPAQLERLVATQPIYAGEQVSTRRFATPAERGIRAQLTGVQRAVAVPGDAQQLLAGTLKTGDRVDVVASWNYPEGSNNHYTRIILRDIRVLDGPRRQRPARKSSPRSPATAATRQRSPSPTPRCRSCSGR